MYVHNCTDIVCIFGASVLVYLCALCTVSVSLFPPPATGGRWDWVDQPSGHCQPGRSWRLQGMRVETGRDGFSPPPRASVQSSLSPGRWLAAVSALFQLLLGHQNQLCDPTGLMLVMNCERHHLNHLNTDCTITPMGAKLIFYIPNMKCFNFVDCILTWKRR